MAAASGMLENETDDKEKKSSKEKVKEQAKGKLDTGKIMALTKAGWTAKDIADECGCSVQAVYDARYRNMLNGFFSYIEGQKKIDIREYSFRKRKEKITMDQEVIKTNQVTVTGEIISDFQYSHKVYGEGFYMTEMSVKRFSEYADIIPVMVSERLIDIEKSYIGQTAEVNGQFRSINRHEGKKNRLILYVFARELEFVSEIPEGDKSNQIFLDGYICKSPIYRKTPLEREIADILVAVNRFYGKSDYIPCICWGRNARFAAAFEVGEHVQLYGRIQSREYRKRISEEETEKRTAFEVSVSGISIV